MDAVEAIELRRARKEAEEKAIEVAIRIRRMFRCDDAWIEEWGPIWKAALVGDRTAPRLTAHQIQRGFDELLSRYKGNQPPKPAHLWDIAKDYLKKPKPKRAAPEPEQPRPPRRPIDRTKAAELMRRAFDHISAVQRIMREHGYGTETAIRLADEQERKFKDWWRAEQAAAEGV